MESMDTIARHSQITVAKPQGEIIRTGEGPMRWRSWLLRERERLMGTWVWTDVWVVDTGDDSALYGVISERAAELMALPGGKA